jgi:hypothetical protein
MHVIGPISIRDDVPVRLNRPHVPAGMNDGLSIIIRKHREAAQLRDERVFGSELSVLRDH